MDIDGLGTVIRNNHEEYLRQFENLNKYLDEKIERVHARIDGTEVELKKHDRSIVKIKSIGTIIGVLWTGFILLFK
ncbi:hypothetical protein LCGC14_2854850 [marine sediment metagenome]|uniref:Uncharacterized protein n=1 Tax=marine sediment metagenome TaxID=412755 RepID=A0A0F9AY91_9ZZZZ